MLLPARAVFVPVGASLFARCHRILNIEPLSTTTLVEMMPYCLPAAWEGLQCVQVAPHDGTHLGGTASDAAGGGAPSAQAEVDGVSRNQVRQGQGAARLCRVCFAIVSERVTLCGPRTCSPAAQPQR